MNEMLEEFLDDLWQHKRFVSCVGAVAGIIAVVGLAIKEDNSYVAENTFTDTVTVDTMTYDLVKFGSNYVKVFGEDGEILKYSGSKDDVENLVFTIKKGGDVEVTGFPSRIGNYTAVDKIKVLPTNYASK